MLFYVKNNLHKKNLILISILVLSFLWYTPNTIFAFTSSSNVSVTAEVVAPSSGGGGGGILSQAIITKAIFKGSAYPNSTVTLLKDGQIVGSTIVGPDANFEISITNISAGNYIFSLYGEDLEKIKSSLSTFPIRVMFGASTTVSGIFLAPTISVNKSEVRRGDNIIIFGQGFPNSKIVIEINSEDEIFVETDTNESGAYLYNFDTSLVQSGQHFTKAKAIIRNIISTSSKSIGFIVGTKNVIKESEYFLIGDFNVDRRVNLIDFSILAFWYKLEAPPAKIDLNDDGIVDLIDFSIMAFYWTG